MKVRDAGVGDAAAIAGVNTRSWQAAYRGLMPDSYLDALSVEEDTARWQCAVAQSALRARAILVVEDGAGEVVGYAVTGADVDEASQGLLFLMYVAPQNWSTGAGRALMDACVDRLWAAGFTRAVLWVLEANARARGFYERQGWAADGESGTSTYGDVPLRALRYAREPGAEDLHVADTVTYSAEPRRRPF